MSTRFENWFVHFVAEHNKPAARLECGELTGHRYDSSPAGCSSETGTVTVSNENTVFYGANVLSFSSRGTRVQNSRSVA